MPKPKPAAPESFGETSHELSDATLIEAARVGDQAAFRALFQRHASTMRSYLYAFLPPHEVEDQLQETALAIWNGLGTLRTTERPLPWMLGIARHRALRALRVKAKQPHSLEQPEQIADAKANASGLSPEDLLRILQRLPEAYRVSLALRLLEQKGSQDIAKALGMTPGSVRVNLTRGMAMLRQHLRREGYP